MSPARPAAPVMLDQAAVADRLGVLRGSVQRYRSADRGKYHFPEPDGHLGRTPWWWSTTIDAWVASRPGKGTGAGRPRKRASTAGRVSPAPQASTRARRKHT